MRRPHLLIAVALTPLLLGACLDTSITAFDEEARVGGPDPSDQTTTPADLTPPNGSVSSLTCVPEEARSAVGNLFQTTDSAVHELITCGGAQVSLARSMFASILFSEPDAMDLEPDTESLLRAILGAEDYTVDAQGDVLMAGNGVDFVIHFDHPDGRPLGVDPLQMENYLQGLAITSTMPFDAMIQDFDARNTYTFAFEGLGPLAPLLNGGEPVTSPITLSLSLADFVALLTGADTDADLGPFTSVGDVVVSSDGALLRRDAETVVSYGFVAADVPVAELADVGRITFDIDDLSAERGDYTLATTGANITFPRQGQLAGQITYRIQGPGVDVQVLSDFGTGRNYPVNSWACLTTPALTPPSRPTP